MKRKVCVITPSLNMGGMDRAGVNFSEALYSQGYEVMLFALFKNDKFFPVPRGIVFKEPDSKEKTKKMNIFLIVTRIRDAVKDFKPDCIIVINELYGAIAMVALFGLNIPIFVSDRASPLYKWPFKQKIFKDLVYSFLKPAGIIAQTKLSAEYKSSYFDSNVKIAVVPNPLREIKLYPGVKKKNQIMGIGRKGDWLKGIDRLIEAFSLLQNTDWRLVLAGVGPDDRILTDQAKRLGVYEKIDFLGKVTEIDRVYCESKIFVIPSRSEGFPNALCEAMAAGLPCIAFDFVAGAREIIKNGINGLLVREGDIKGLAEAIEKLINSEFEREKLSVNAVKIKDELNVSVIGKKLAAFITSQEGLFK